MNGTPKEVKIAKEIRAKFESFAHCVPNEIREGKVKHVSLKGREPLGDYAEKKVAEILAWDEASHWISWKDALSTKERFTYRIIMEPT